jgi:hypothetical protein
VGALAAFARAEAETNAAKVARKEAAGKREVAPLGAGLYVLETIEI